MDGFEIFFIFRYYACTSGKGGSGYGVDCGMRVITCFAQSPGGGNHNHLLCILREVMFRKGNAGFKKGFNWSLARLELSEMCKEIQDQGMKYIPNTNKAL